ncbi:hypothetical protein AB205_0080690 [Aquarana catesbeiana]|uniref:Uncharacterized protein n=1 Tax=Aquarana catesbeiana TaxID=8400 RepID=A0A2G9RR95_AQUCT|nr:hypothetical protein AB205_0080690 [Aquarana catesbeiana]
MLTLGMGSGGKSPFLLSICVHLQNLASTGVTSPHLIKAIPTHFGHTNV